MKLSAEYFAELAASFDATQSLTTHERRRAARLDLQARIRIRMMAGDQRQEPVSVVVSNFSARGLSLIFPNEMPVGQQFITELPRKGGGFVELLCTALHCRPAGPNNFRIGAEFTCVVPVSGFRPAATSAEDLKRISDSIMG